MAIGIALFSISGIALAAPAVDTLLNHGYDSEQMALIFGVSPVDQEDDLEITLDCTLDGTFKYTIAAPEPAGEGDVVEDEGDEKGKKEVVITPIDELTDSDDETVTFNDEDDETEDEAVDYGSEEAAECGLVSVSVVGPNGQVNHGQVVSTFVHAIRMMDLDIKGKGCLVKLIAGSDYGKGDQQVKAGEEVEVPEPNEDGSISGEVELTGDTTSCGKKDKGSNGESTERGNGKAKVKNDGGGKPEWAGTKAGGKNKNG